MTERPRMTPEQLDALRTLVRTGRAGRDVAAIVGAIDALEEELREVARTLARRAIDAEAAREVAEHARARAERAAQSERRWAEAVGYHSDVVDHALEQARDAHERMEEVISVEHLRERAAAARDAALQQQREETEERLACYPLRRGGVCPARSASLVPRADAYPAPEGECFLCPHRRA